MRDRAARGVYLFSRSQSLGTHGKLPFTSGFSRETQVTLAKAGSFLRGIIGLVSTPVPVAIIGADVADLSGT
jgi:hypothetical protein